MDVRAEDRSEWNSVPQDQPQQGADAEEHQRRVHHPEPDQRCGQDIRARHSSEEPEGATGIVKVGTQIISVADHPNE